MTTGHDTFDYIVTGAGCGRIRCQASPSLPGYACLVGDPVHFSRSRKTASDMILEDARIGS
jgi:hypothetical protein